MGIRLQDIADELGVSKVTVSKVLRGRPDVGKETRERIEKRMRELNYRPNYQARALAGGQTHSIGLIVPDLVHPFFAEVAKGVSAAVRRSGRVLLLGSSEEDPAIERQQIEALLGRGVDALLLASCQSRLPAWTKKTACVLLDRNFPSKKLPFVGTDNYRAGLLATEHLLALGRKRIAHIGSEAGSTGRDRLRAYRDALEAKRLRVPESFVVIRERFEESGDRAGYEAMRLLLKHKRPPDAVFCYNDTTAIGAMAAAEAAGLRVPEDIAFVGCGNFRYAPYLRVPLTSVDQSAQALGAAAGELAISHIEVPALQARTVLLAPKLVVRTSTISLPPDPNR